MGSSHLPKKILVIDGDKVAIAPIAAALEKLGVKVDIATDRQTALYLFNQNAYSVVIVESGFSEIPGLVLLQTWRAHEVESKRLVSGLVSIGNRSDHDPKSIALGSELEGIEFIDKPFNQIKLLPAIQRAYAKYLANSKFSEFANEMRVSLGSESNLPSVIGRIKQSISEFGPKSIDLMRDAYEQTGKWEEALELVEGQISKEPRQIRHLNSKGRILLRLGRHDKALKVMEQADRMAPHNIDRINNMALAYLEANQVDRSLEKMREVLSYEEEGSNKKFEFFSQLYDHGFDEAAQTLCKETTSPVEVVRHYNNLGVALARSGKMDQAIAQYERCLKFYPKYKENYRICYNLALAYLTYKQKSQDLKAVKYLEQCLVHNKKYEKAQGMLESVKRRLDGYSSVSGDPKAS